MLPNAGSGTPRKSPPYDENAKAALEEARRRGAVILLLDGKRPAGASFEESMARGWADIKRHDGNFGLWHGPIVKDGVRCQIGCIDADWSDDFERIEGLLDDAGVAYAREVTPGVDKPGQGRHYWMMLHAGKDMTKLGAGADALRCSPDYVDNKRLTVIYDPESLARLLRPPARIVTARLYQLLDAAFNAQETREIAPVRRSKGDQVVEYQEPQQNDLSGIPSDCARAGYWEGNRGNQLYSDIFYSVLRNQSYGRYLELASRAGLSKDKPGGQIDGIIRRATRAAQRRIKRAELAMATLPIELTATEYQIVEAIYRFPKLNDFYAAIKTIAGVTDFAAGTVHKIFGKLTGKGFWRRLGRLAPGNRRTILYRPAFSRSKLLKMRAAQRERKSIQSVPADLKKAVGTLEKEGNESKRWGEGDIETRTTPRIRSHVVTNTVDGRDRARELSESRALW